MNIQVIHTLNKPYDKLYAGIYIQVPEVGVPDRRGIYYRKIYESLKIKESPNDVISKCIEEVFRRTETVDVITYVGPRRSYTEIFRSDSSEEIRKKVQAG